MQNEELKALIEDAVNDTDLRVGEIPSIDLYLDQITCLMSEQLSRGSPRFRDRILTKTMVNNYSKDGLLSPLNGKKYSKEQFLQMLLVYARKNTLSIGEIKQVLQSVYALEEYDKLFLESAYERYLNEKQRMREHANDFVQGYLAKTKLDPAREEDFLVLLLTLSCMSSYIKNAAQALIEAHYPDPNSEREREKEDAKRQKAERKKNAAKAKKKQVEPLEPTEEVQ